MIQTNLGTSRLLARPGEGRLWVLDASATALWDLHLAGWGPAPLAGLLAATLLLFPSYRPGIAPSLAPLASAGVLQAMVAAEAVHRDLDQAKLAALARWVSAVPAYVLNYPDLDTGLGQVRGCLAAP